MRAGGKNTQSAEKTTLFEQITPNPDNHERETADIQVAHSRYTGSTPQRPLARIRRKQASYTVWSLKTKSQDPFC